MMNREEMKLKYGAERVLCVDTVKFKNLTETENFEKVVSMYGTYYYRFSVEDDQTKKQIIPYVVLKSGDKYMFAKRLKGDPRLTGGYTMGMGGHVDYIDLVMAGVAGLNYRATIHNCIMRELSEETTFDADTNFTLNFVDNFIDESNDVSAVHACILVVIELEDTDVKIKETDKLEAQWLAIEDVTDKMYDSLEGWSKIAYQKLFGDRVKFKSKSVRKREKAQAEAEIAKEAEVNEINESEQGE